MIKLFDSFIGRISFILFTLLFTIVCTRFYGAEIFGQYSYAFSIVTILMIFAKLGLDNGLVYYMPKSGNSLITISILATVVASIFLCIVAGFFINDVFVKIMLPLTILAAVEQVFFGVYRATGEIRKYYLINSLLSSFLRVILVIIFYYVFGKNFISVALAVYISFIVATIIYLAQNRSRFTKINYDSTYFKYSFSLVAAAMMGVINDRIDILMLGRMTTMADVGYYQVAVQMSSFILMILLIFDTVFGPMVSKLYHSGQIEKLKKQYITSTRLLGLAALVTVTIMFLSSRYIMLIFGEDFVEGQMAFILRGLGQFINVAVGSVWMMLAMTGKTRIHIWTNLLGLTLNFVFNLLLIPNYGMEGAAVSSMISIAVINIIGYVAVCRTFNLKAYKFI